MTKDVGQADGVLSMQKRRVARCWHPSHAGIPQTPRAPEGSHGAGSRLSCPTARLHRTGCSQAHETPPASKLQTETEPPGDGGHWGLALGSGAGRATRSPSNHPPPRSQAFI